MDADRADHAKNLTDVHFSQTLSRCELRPLLLQVVVALAPG